MTDSSNLEDFSAASAKQWELLVMHALLTREEHIKDHAAMLANRAKISKEAMLQKILAVRWAATNGFTSQDIITKGQSAILTAYRKARRNGSEDPQRLLAWRVSKSLADAIMCEDASPDSEEALVTRLARVVEFKTSEELWMFFHALFADLSDNEIRNLAGEGPPPKVKRVSSKTEAG